jgi:methyl-accepting chemotaxis protein
MGVLVAVLAVLMANRITRPLKKLAAAAQEIADGNLKVEINAESNDETGDVASAMHETATMLSSYIDYIHEITQVLNQISEGDLTFNTTITNLSHYKSGFALSTDKMVKATANEINVMHTKC